MKTWSVLLMCCCFTALKHCPCFLCEEISANFFVIDETLAVQNVGCVYLYQWWRIRLRNPHAILKLAEMQHCSDSGARMLDIDNFDRMSKQLQFNPKLRTIYIADEIAGKAILVNILPTTGGTLAFHVDLNDARMSLKDISYKPTHFVCYNVTCPPTEAPDLDNNLDGNGRRITAWPKSATVDSVDAAAHTPNDSFHSSALRYFRHPNTVLVCLAVSGALIICLSCVILLLACWLRRMHSQVLHQLTTIDYLSTVKKSQGFNGNIHRRIQQQQWKQAATLGLYGGSGVGVAVSSAPTRKRVVMATFTGPSTADTTSTCDHPDYYKKSADPLQGCTV